MRSASLTLVSAVLLVACVKPNPAFGDESETSGASTTTVALTTGTDATTEDLSSGTDTPTMASAGGSATEAASEPISDSTTSGSTGPEGTSTTTDSTTGTTGDGGPPATCAEARDRGGTDSGVFTLAVPGQPGATTEVWCEQQLADGGWLLVARSAPDDNPPAFGWGSVAGDILDDGEPYSLGLLAYKFPASELLIGSYFEGKQLGGHAYKFAAPPDFPFPFDDSAGPTSAAQRVIGDCDPAGGPGMIRWIGYTKLGDRFRMRDKPEADPGDMFGLFATGFYLGGDNCSSAGKLDGSQGMIFVR